MTNVDTEIHKFKFIFRELEKKQIRFLVNISSTMDQIFVKNVVKKIENFVKNGKFKLIKKNKSKIENLN